MNQEQFQGVLYIVEMLFIVWIVHLLLELVKVLNEHKKAIALIMDALKPTGSIIHVKVGHPAQVAAQIEQFLRQGRVDHGSEAPDQQAPERP